MRNFTVSLLLLMSFAPDSFSQITFQKTYGSANLEEGRSVLALPDGYLVTGSTTGFGAGGKDVFVMKTDLSGNEIWSHVYGGSLDDEAFSVQPTYDSGFIIAGVTLSYTGPSLQDHSNIYLLKIDSTGNYLWSKTIHSGELDAAYSVKETADHGFIMTGYTGSFVNGPDNLLLVKTDSSGVIEWTKILGSASNSVDVGKAVIQTRDGGFAAAGFSTAFSNQGDTSAFIAILNPAGNVMFTRHIAITDISISAPSPQTSALDLIQNTDGNLVIVGSAGGIFSGVVYINYPFMILTDSTGNYTSGNIYGFNTGDNRTLSVHQTPDGGYINGGYMGIHHPMLFKTDASMTTQWAWYYGNYTAPNFSRGLGFSTAITADGGYILTGYKETNPGYRIHLIKADSSGQSGCNQGVPNFPGLGNPAVVNLLSGTVFSPGFSNAAVVVSQYSGSSFTDSSLCISTSIDDLPVNNFSVEIYPNPSDDHVTVAYTIHESEKVTCSLITSTGKLLITTELTGTENSVRLNTSDLSPGVYQLQFRNTSGASFNSKIVVIH